MRHMQSSSTVGSSTCCEEDFQCDDNTSLLRLEKEACALLGTTHNLNELRLICSLFPFQDSNTPREVLSRRWEPSINAFLISLGGNAYSTRDKKTDTRSKPDKAKEILSLLRPKPSSSAPTWDFDWKPPLVALPENVRTAANDIDRQVGKTIGGVYFSDWIEAAVGYQPVFITSLLDGVRNARDQQRRYLEMLYQPEENYRLLEMDLRFRHPLAHWIVCNGLGCANCPSDPCDALGILFWPIRQLLAREDLALVEILRRLAVLEIRFEDRLLGTEEVRWDKPLSTDFSFLKNICRIDPATLATSITDNDAAHFLSLSARDIRSPNSTHTYALSKEWTKLATNVRECVSAHRDLVKPISKVVKELFHLRNYHSGTAMLVGFTNARTYPDELLIYWKLVDTADNYAIYRTEWLRNPGLPFLFPHLYELNHAPNPARILSQIFLFVAFFDWRNESRESIEDDLRGMDESDLHGVDENDRPPYSWYFIKRYICI